MLDDSSILAQMCGGATAHSNSQQGGEEKSWTHLEVLFLAPLAAESGMRSRCLLRCRTSPLPTRLAPAGRSDSPTSTFGTEIRYVQVTQVLFPRELTL
jgi:hypothetical protein